MEKKSRCRKKKQLKNKKKTIVFTSKSTYFVVDLVKSGRIFFLLFFSGIGCHQDTLSWFNMIIFLVLPDQVLQLHAFCRLCVRGALKNMPAQSEDIWRAAPRDTPTENSSKLFIFSSTAENMNRLVTFSEMAPDFGNFAPQIITSNSWRQTLSFPRITRQTAGWFWPLKNLRESNTSTGAPSQKG